MTGKRMQGMTGKRVLSMAGKLRTIGQHSPLFIHDHALSGEGHTNTFAERSYGLSLFLNDVNAARQATPRRLARLPKVAG